MKIAIIGATGYGGAELIRILHHHPEANVYSVHSSSKHGMAFQESYPHLQTLYSQTLEQINPSEMAGKVDLVFTATPSGVSSKITPKLLGEGLKVIDLSGDFRLKEPKLYDKWYNKIAAPQHIISESVYGLSEWMEEEIKNASLIANPGCYPTATLLGLAPLLKASAVNEHSIIIDAKSGLSGAGRSLSTAAHYTEANDNVRIYKVNQHQHIPEIEQMMSQWLPEVSPITFSTHLVPMTRGIMCTIYADANSAMTEQQLRELYITSYEDSPFVRIRKTGEYPSTKDVYGSNFCDIGVTYDERTGRITVVSVIDNLMKGAAGQAVQNLNIMMGLDQKTGLDFVPMYP